MSLVKTHNQFIKYAQEQYKDALEKQSSEHADFWLGQMQGLCQQVYWLQATPQDVSRIPESKITRFQVEVPVQPVKTQPTSYAWNDGFEGVTLEEAWDER